MKNIQQKQPEFQKADLDRVMKRVRRLKGFFETVPANSQEKILAMLASEIKHVEDEAIRLWLGRFRDILSTIHREVWANV